MWGEGEQQKAVEMRLPSPYRDLNCRVNFATAQLSNLVKIITPLATVFCFDYVRA